MQPYQFTKIDLQMSADLRTIRQIVPPVQPIANIEDLSIPWPCFATFDAFLSVSNATDIPRSSASTSKACFSGA